MVKPRRYGITFAPVFDMVMRDEGLCRGFLERVLHTKVGQIHYVNTEEEITPALGARGVRLDAFIEGEGAVYDIDMQTYKEDALALRLRYVQSAMDISLLQKGDVFDVLPKSFVIFVCTFDAFGCGHPIYTLKRACNEDSSLKDIDDTTWIVLNASAW